MSLIQKYKLTDKDLFQLGYIESKKKVSGILEKENLKAASISILKKYNVSFIDIGSILTEIKNGNFHDKLSHNFSDSEKAELINEIKMNASSKKFYQDWWSSKSKRQKLFWAIGVLFILGLIGELTSPSVDPCKCAEVGANAQTIGYHNLSDDSRKIFDACESKYSSPADAYNDCVNKVSSEL